MSIEIYYLLAGLILMFIALSRSMVQRGPFTSAMVYLTVGWLLSPRGLGYLPVDPVAHAGILERWSELAVVISLFVCGMHLQASWRDKIWRVPLRLAFVSMSLTVFFVSLAAYFTLQWPLGVCLVLGAVLAPTDPVLASEVRVEGAEDRDPLRFSLTGEGSFNDGTAFPFLYLGLGLLGYHRLGSWWSTWWLMDVLWGILGGLAIGAVLGTVTGRLIGHFVPDRQQGAQEFLGFGLVFTAYGAAVSLHAHGFLAAFAAGLALRWSESDDKEEADLSLAPEVLSIKERVERLLEAVTVILIGVLVFSHPWDLAVFWLAPLLFFVLRPCAVYLGLLGDYTLGKGRLGYVSWFGVRGIGSVYYLSYAIEAGLPTLLAQQMAGIVYPILACSIVLHGLTVQPLMRRYSGRS